MCTACKLAQAGGQYHFIFRQSTDPAAAELVEASERKEHHAFRTKKKKKKRKCSVPL